MSDSQKEIKSIADLTKVPEFLLKKRKRNVKSKHTDQRKTRAQTAVAVRQRKNPKPLNFKRLEWYVDRALRREWERERIIKEARKPESWQESNLENLEKNNKTESQNVILVIRTCRPFKMTKAVKKLLESDFSLTKIYQAKLFRMDQDLLYKLTILKDHIVWGNISENLIRDLILKRGRIGTHKDPEPLNNNLKIEAALGEKCGIICLEDIIFELTGKGSEHFETVTNFILPFQLSMPEGGKRAVANFENNKPGFKEEEEYKELILKMV